MSKNVVIDLGDLDDDTQDYSLQTLKTDQYLADIESKKGRHHFISIPYTLWRFGSTICEHFIRGLTRREIRRFSIYGCVAKSAVYSRGLALYNNEMIRYKGFNNKRCRFYFWCNGYDLNIKFTKIAITQRLKSSIDITDILCDCPYEEICKHAIAAMLMLSVPDYKLKKLPVIEDFQVFLIFFDVF